MFRKSFDCQNSPLPVVENAMESLQEVVCLYDQTGNILHISAAIPPYEVANLIGQPAWLHLNELDRRICQSAILQCLHDDCPLAFDVSPPHVGIWRTWLYPCRVGKVRIVGISKRLPQQVLQLTERERQVCRLLGMGRCSKQIAANLEVARSTIDNLRANAARRLGLRPGSLTAWSAANLQWLE
jgi:DNA-binding CsgD family transcriptional regulator